MNLQEIEKEVLEAYGIEFKGKGRARREFIPRTIFCNLAIEFSGETITTIGKYINRDHTMVIYYRDNFKYALDREDKEVYESLKEKILEKSNAAARQSILKWFKSIPEDRYRKVLKRIETMQI